MNLVVRTRDTPAPGSQEVEVVERKGLGHPDTICDGVAEQISLALCHHYLERFGRVLHHNVDKVLLVGGAAHARFGGGEITEPIEIYLAGRATEVCRGERIPVHDIATEACRGWLKRTLPWLDVDRNVRIISRLRPGSTDLSGLFDRRAVEPLANDTSCGAGFAPLTDLERVVLEVERTLNASDTKQTHPEIGQDIKVMGVRHGRQIRLTIACAFVSRFVRDAADYLDKKNTALGLALETARRVTGRGVDAVVNAADDMANGEGFLTVTGTSAEAGDDGEVGRGNRTSGLITPYRVMTMEAAAGKNPVTHVGKLYNVLATRIASAIAANIPGVIDSECVLVGQIGRPVSDPAIVDVRLGSGDDRIMSTALRHQVRDLVEAELGQLSALRDALIHESVSLF